MARIDDVLRRIPDAQLRAELTSAITEVRRTKDFGLVGHRRTASGDFVTDFDTYRALSFDCYGTLIDWETGIVNALQPWSAWRGVDRSSSELLELFGEHESHIEAEHPAMPYPEVLAEVMRRLATSLSSLTPR